MLRGAIATHQRTYRDGRTPISNLEIVFCFNFFFLHRQDMNYIIPRRRRRRRRRRPESGIFNHNPSLDYHHEVWVVMMLRSDY